MKIRDLGLRWSLGDLFSAVGVTVVSYVAYSVGYFLVHSLPDRFFPASQGVTFQEMFAHPSMMAIPYFLLNPFFEEIIVRAYLMSEVKDLTGSWILAAVTSILIQASYHIYYGWQGAIMLAFQFLVFAAYYARTRRATPVILAHGIFDILGLARLF
jgi:membrane protease YdiL (CAAX protease family)